MREFDNGTLLLINQFENMSKTEIRDCIIGECLYFLVDTGKVAQAVGKSGKIVKSAENRLGKPIKIFEWSEDSTQFLKNMIPAAQKIEVNNSKASVTLNSKDRGAVIGKAGSNIKIIREMLERNSDIKELKIL